VCIKIIQVKENCEISDTIHPQAAGLSFIFDFLTSFVEVEQEPEFVQALAWSERWFSSRIAPPLDASSPPTVELRHF